MRPSPICLLSAACLVGLLPEPVALRSADEPPKTSPSGKPPWQRLLQGEDAKKAAELEKKRDQLQEAGKFEEALKLVQELAELRQKQQGADHWEAVSARHDVEALRRVLRQEKQAQAEYAGCFSQQREADGLVQKGRYREAQPLLEKVLAIRRQVLGEDHPDTAAGYSYLAYALAAAGKYQEAEEGYREALAIRRRVLGEAHPDTARSYNNLAANLNAQAKYHQAEEGFRKALVIRRRVLGEHHPDTAMSYNNVAFNLHSQGQYQQAEEGFEKALAIQRQVVGEDHPDTANSYNNVGFNLQAQGKYQEAEDWYHKSLAICRKVLGEDHPLTARGYNNVAFNLDAQGKYQQAEEGFRKALAIRRKVLGEDHPDTARGYHNVAANLQAQGKYQEAEQGLRRGLAINRKVLGEDHPDTAISYNTLAFNLNQQGKYQEADEGHRKALAIQRTVLGEDHAETAKSYNNVAANLQALGKYQEAEENLHKALAIWRKVFGEDHPDTAGCYNNVAANLQAQGKYPQAEEGFRKALAIRRKVLGEDHPDTAQSYSNLANNLVAQGKYRQTEESLRKALAIFRKVLSENHPRTALSYNSVAKNLYAQGKYEEAESFWVQAADGFTKVRPWIAASGLGRSTKTSEQSPLPSLAGALARKGKIEAAWQRFEESLGRGTWDDLSARLRRPLPEQEKQAQLVATLTRLDHLLEKIVAKDITPEQDKRRKDLLSQRLKAQDELTDFASKMEEKYGPAVGQVFERQKIQAALPADVALVGWLDLAPAGPKATDPNGEHWAVLLRSAGAPVWVRLRGSGPEGAWTDEDTALPQRLRTAMLSPRGEWSNVADRLREQRLKPLSQHLAAGEKLPAVRHVVVLPSTALAGVPVETLVPDYTVSYASSGTLYAHLKGQPAVKGVGLLALGDPVFEPAAAAAKERPLPPGGVLLTVVQPGSNAAEAQLRPDDVLLKYGDTELKTPADLKTALASADPKAEVPVRVWREGATFERRVHPGKLGIVMADKPAPEALAERYRLDRVLASRSGDDGWKALPGTRVEVQALRRLFGAKPEPKLLFDSDASEQKLDELAHSGELGQYRYLHLATHGEVDDKVSLRSAVILSRDKLPDPEKQLLAGQPIYDGRLTAEEMLRSWHLNAELVTLSACQTALGKYERGEGFMGFAQALLLCGSRSVCLSLWKVDDAATALLMQRFYANLLGKREGLKTPLPKAQALREAKEWLRTLPRDEALRVAAALSQGVERGKDRPKQNLRPPLPEATAAVKEDCPYAHPYYWAAFVLIGDPD